MSYASSLSPSQTASIPQGVNRYVSEAYSYFFASLASMAILGVISYHLLPQSSMMGLAIADSIIWIACGWFGWRNPISFVFPLFTIITGLLLGQLAHFYSTVFAATTIITLAAFCGLTAFVWITRWDFSFLSGFLCLAFFVLIGGWITSFFINSTGFLLGWTGFGVFTFGCWILYDTSNILNRAGDGESSAVAAFELILDIVGFHRWLLEHLNIWDLTDN